MSIVLRTAQVGDALALEALIFELIGRHNDPAALAAQVEKMAAHPDYCLLVACQDEQILGSAMGIRCMDLCYGDAPFLLIENVIVTQKAQGHGVGRKMLDHLEHWAIASGCTSAILVSSAFRTDAHAFYRAVGYTQEGGFRKMFV